jgi:hypothetical protein
MKGILCLERALTILATLLKTWWLGTELNRRRQPFQNSYFPCFQQLLGLLWDCHCNRCGVDKAGNLQIGGTDTGSQTCRQHQVIGNQMTPATAETILNEATEEQARAKRVCGTRGIRLCYLIHR